MKLDRAVIWVVAAVAVAVAMSVPRPMQADDDEGDRGFTCSESTLRGEYGFSIGGTVAAGTPNARILNAVAMTHFDGHGGLTQVDFATFNGVPQSPDWRPATGTYQLDENCTGSALITPAFGPPLDLRLVIMERGRRIRTVVVGNATWSEGIRVR